MSTGRKILQGTAVAYLSHGVSAVVAFLLVPFLISSLGVTRYGVIGVMQSILLLATLLDLGMRPATLRQISRWLAAGDGERASVVAGTAFTLYLGTGLVITVVALSIGHGLIGYLKIPSDLSSESYAALVLGAVATGLTLVSSVHFSALGSRLRFDVQYTARIAGHLLYAGVLVVGLTVFTPTLPTWGLAMIVSACTGLWIARRYSRRVCPELRIGPSALTGSGLRDLGGVTAYTSILSLCQWVVIRSGPLLLTVYLGPEMVGRYTPAVALVLALQPLWNALLYQLPPLVTEAWTRSDPERIRRITIRGTRYSLLLGGGALVLLGGVARPLIELWLGPGFDATATVLVLWVAVLGSHVANGANGALFLGLGRLGPMAITEVLTALAYVVGSVALLRWTDLGILSIPLALLATQTVRLVILFFVAARLMALAPLRYLEQAYLAPAACFVVLGALLIAIRSFGPPHPAMQLLLSAGLGGPLYAGLAWRLGLRRSDREEAWSMVSSVGQGPELES